MPAVFKREYSQMFENSKNIMPKMGYPYLSEYLYSFSNV